MKKIKSIDTFNIYSISKDDIKIAETKILRLPQVNETTNAVKWFKIKTRAYDLTLQKALKYLNVEKFNGLNHGFNDIKKAVHTSKGLTVIKNEK